MTKIKNDSSYKNEDPSYGTSSPTVKKVGIKKGRKKNPYWSGPLPVIANIPVITRNIDSLMTRYLELERRVPRSIDFTKDNELEKVEFTYIIPTERGDYVGTLTFNESEDINYVTLRMVGRLIYKFWTVGIRTQSGPDLESHFNRTIDRMNLDEDEVSVVRKQFMDDLLEERGSYE